MDLTIPEEVNFRITLEVPKDARVIGEITRSFDLCFMHAVKIAMQGQQVEIQLGEYRNGCDICNEGGIRYLPDWFPFK